MSTITLRGLPDPVHDALRSAADEAHRSLNSELLHRLEASVDPGPPHPYAPGPSDAGPPEGWRPRPPTGALEVREPPAAWGREVVDATATPIVVAVSGHSFDLPRRSAMLIASEPDAGWLKLEWHWIRVEGEETVPSGSARLSIEGLRRAGLGRHATFTREDIVALVSDLALDALARQDPDVFPLRRIQRFDDAPPSTLLLLRIDPVARAQLEAVRDRTRLIALREHLDRLLEIDVEVTTSEAAERSDDGSGASAHGPAPRNP